MASKKLGPAEQLAAFYDAGVYTTLSESDAGVTAYGMVGGQGAYTICQNGQAQSASDVKMGRRVLKLAAETGNPVVSFYDSTGSKIDDGLASLKSAGKMATAAAKVSGVVPQLAVVTGVCGASAAMAAACADLCIVTKEAQMFLSSPFLSAAAGDKTPGAGSADSAVEAGVANVVVDTAEEAAKLAAKLLMLLPQNNLSDAGTFEYAPSAVAWPAKYTGQGAIDALVDTDSAVELFAGFGDGIITALATMDGNTVGVAAANGPDTYMGWKCSLRAARFARLCDAYSIPLVTVLNTGGFIMSTQSDEAGNIRAAARLAATYADATCAKVAVLAGATYAPTYAALGNADLTVAMEGSVTAPLAPQAAATVLYKDEIEGSDKSIEAATAEYAKQYETEVASAKAVQKSGVADFVATGADVRKTVVSALEILGSKRAQRMPKKHGNMSL